MNKLLILLLLCISSVFAQDFFVSFGGNDWQKISEDLEHTTYCAEFNLPQELRFTDNDKIHLYSYKQYKLLFKLSKKIHKLEISGIESKSKSIYRQIEGGNWYKHTMDNDDELITFSSYSILANFKAYVKVKNNELKTTRGGPKPRPEDISLYLSLEAQPLKFDNINDVITKIGVSYLGFDGLAKIRGVSKGYLAASELEELKRETEFSSLDLRGKYQKYNQDSKGECIIL